MNEFFIERTEDPHEIERAIRLCDSSFPVGICNRDDFDEIFEKISKYAEVYVAYENDTICGYAAMYNNDAQNACAYITMIGVREEWQRNHIGRELMNICIRRAKENQMVAIRLEVFKSNSKAIGFYERMGFRYERDCTQDSNYMRLNL